MTPEGNPYRSPQAADGSTSPLDEPAEVSWKAIAKRWEMLRLPYNFFVGLAGLLALAMIPELQWEDAIVGVIGYGLCANVMYLLGPVTEMYLNWFVDALEDRLLPGRLAAFVRSPYLTGLLWIGGTLFSIGLTLAVGLSEAFAVMLPDQQ